MAAPAALGLCVRRLCAWFAALVLATGCGSATLGANRALIIAGLGGQPEYEKQFVHLAKDLEAELAPSTVVTTLSGSAATRERVAQELTRAAQQLVPADTFSLFLIGHGTFDGEAYKFNLPGPDITAGELAKLLKAIPSRKQLIVDMSSASGAAAQQLAANGRVVITATKSGTEKNAPVFARFWVEALRDPAADADKNGTVTAQEAYSYTERHVKAYFESEKLLATEHATITNDRSPSLFAVLSKENVSDRGETAARGPGARRADELEVRVERLKENKGSMSPAAYKQQLTALLVELARLDAEGNP